MCGITGWIDWETDLTQRKDILEAMTRRLTPRGPDAEGYWASTHAGIGHRRLIVVDPEGGRQPMVRAMGEKTYVLTYNGELYNTDEVRAKLIAKGHRFQSYSDTEVVLVSYIEWGEDCVREFNGIYAFGVWEESTQSLFLARDRMGVKPLFYTQQGASLIFASEIKALLAHPNVQPVLDAEGVAEIIGLGPARTPGSGVFKGIKEVRPGHSLFYNRYHLKTRQYWSLISQPHTDDLNQTTEKVRELVEDSIKRQLVSDVPVCTLLSGGLDSSIITAVAARVYQNQGECLDTYSIDYYENDRYFKPSDFQPNSDAPWIERVNGYLGTRPHRILLDTPQLAESLQQAAIARDLPGMADVDSSLYLFCREIKKGATVALSGECADEVFGGYPWFHRPEAFAADTFPWSLAVDFRNRLIAPTIREKVNLLDYVASRYQDTLKEVPGLPGESKEDARRREIFYLNLNWFMAVLLDRKDRMSMASGLEVRVPFCDHRIVEYVWNIPWHMKTCDNREKGILRRAALGLLPEEVVLRKKSPYPKTHHPHYEHMMRDELSKILGKSEEPLHHILDKKYLTYLINSADNITKPWFGQLMTGPQLMAYLLQVNFWLKLFEIQVQIN